MCGPPVGLLRDHEVRPVKHAGTTTKERIPRKVHNLLTGDKVATGLLRDLVLDLRLGQGLQVADPGNFFYI